MAYYGKLTEATSSLGTITVQQALKNLQRGFCMLAVENTAPGKTVHQQALQHETEREA